MNHPKTQPAGWILYDDSCGICRRWVPFWENTLRKHGFEIAPLQADWVRAKLQMNETELMQDLWLLLPNRLSAARAEMDRLLEGYETFLAFPDETLRLIEPLPRSISELVRRFRDALDGWEES